MKVSIIVPVYNTEKYLSKCIESVLNQTFKDFELILINDGSTDCSYDICKEYAQTDSRIVLINQNNMGVARTRNVGLDNAKGEYVAWVDSDDWIDITYIQQLYDHSIKNGDIPVFALRKKEKEHKFYDNEIILAFLDGKIGSNMWSTFFKRELYEGLRFSDYPIGEDSIMIVNLISRINSIYCFSCEGYHYIDNASSLTRNMNATKLLAWMNELSTQKELVEKIFPHAISKMNYKVMMFMADVIKSKQSREIKDIAIKHYKSSIENINLCNLSLKQIKKYIITKFEVRRLLLK